MMLRRCGLQALSCTKNLKVAKSNSYSYFGCRFKSVRIGCSSGFFGDTTVSARQLVEKGKLDFLVMDYLSEITMSLLVAAQKKNPALGFIPDFVQQARVLMAAKAKGVKVVANAGGINPHGCAAALKQVLGDKADSLKIAVVTGDNLIERLDEMKSADVKEMSSGMPLCDTTNSMTAYLGAVPISMALHSEADVVITGRCTDSALALGPLMYSHGWKETDLDLLACGSLAGHLIECGAQATGGVFTDWHSVEGWDDIGFPIVQCEADGSFTLSKSPGTGGLVTPATVSEQLLYEIHDPTEYILPDVVCDFTQVTVESTGNSDEVLVRGARGRPPSDSYKVCSTYSDGFRLTAVCVLGGPKSAEKARKTANAILKRVAREAELLGLEPITSYNLQVLGSEQTYGPHADVHIAQNNREAVLWLAAHHHDKKVLEILSKELAPAGTGMAPGLTALVGGRPKVSPVFSLFSFLYPKSKIEVKVDVNGETIGSYVANHNTAPPQPTSSPSEAEHPIGPLTGSASYRVEELAYTRSGDKGNHCNIGVVSRHPKLYPVLVEHLTAEKVANYFKHVFDGEPEVIRYEVPGIKGLNFVLKNSLGGGGIASLRSDPQGKAYGQMMLDMTLSDLPDDLKL
ncbi:hypothetical protein EB796_005215 [Bugula neritina]|uniref:Uncharacterized protein n=1 Tax=Bugula neritina TaxID=10212 RepID=A0A7J7KE36_BUGNE|nr:hypothetical protein EB796_005215 [Bugula neritina]